MNSLSHGFLFLVGLSWLLCEACVSASAGYWTPVWLFLAGFIVMFAIMGCLPVSEKTINTAGPIFTALIGVGIACYGVDSFGEGVKSLFKGDLTSTFVGGFLQIFGGATMIVLAAISFLSREKAAAHH